LFSLAFGELANLVEAAAPLIRPCLGGESPQKSGLTLNMALLGGLDIFQAIRGDLDDGFRG
jgi:hypothetical protein